MPQPATSTWASAAQRSRKIESAIAVVPCGLFVASTTASTKPATKPAPAPVAAAAFRARRGTNTATSRSSPDAASIASEGESANQSTCGRLTNTISECVTAGSRRRGR